MREHPRGDIVFISSVATLSNAADGAPYNMGKAAMEALAFTLAKEELRHGIRVNIVAPGLVDTDMGQKLMRAVAGVEDSGPSMPHAVGPGLSARGRGQRGALPGATPPAT